MLISKILQFHFLPWLLSKRYPVILSALSTSTSLMYCRWSRPSLSVAIWASSLFKFWLILARSCMLIPFNLSSRSPRPAPPGAFESILSSLMRCLRRASELSSNSTCAYFTAASFSAWLCWKSDCWLFDKERSSPRSAIFYARYCLALVVPDWAPYTLAGASNLLGSLASPLSSKSL